ncbi:hypothetical protein F9K50_08700 [bacterium]|nr:MAG: hypothetical protein F9K50_08700 [bacterium]
MSEPAENNEFKKFGETFEKKISELSDTVEKTTKALETKVENLAAKKETQSKKEDDDDGFDDDLFGEDKTIEKQLEKKVEEKLGEFKKEQKTQSLYEKECAKWDGKAYEEFPMKKADFRQEVEKEIAKNMMPIGKDEEGNPLYPPDAVYNAAARVFARKVKAKQLPVDDPEPEEIDGGDPRRRVKGKDITETQLEIARRLGIKEERAREVVKNYAGRKKR